MSSSPPWIRSGTAARAVACLALVAALAVLQGCTPAAVLGQVVPMGLVAGSIAGSKDDLVNDGHVRYGQRSQAQMDLDRLYTHVALAECGDPESQFWLGEQVEHNGQVPPQHVEAYRWYRLAETNGHESAATSREALAAQMTDAQVTEAEALAAAWAPQTKDCAATS